MFKSKEYWENRYKSNGNSGLGSYGDEAKFKSNYINDAIIKYNIKSINDFGCGDGNQISQLENFEIYCGTDVSNTTLLNCIQKFKNVNKYKFVSNISEMNDADLCMSLDVLYHITEDDYFNDYMHNLFSLSKKYVLIYSVNSNELTTVPHMKYRDFLSWIEKNVSDFKLIDSSKYEKKNNGVGFFLFMKQ
jgi:hypothetical protein